MRMIPRPGSLGVPGAVLLRLLVLLLVPLVIVTMPGLAEASTTYGTAKSVYWKFNGNGSGTELDCGMDAYYVVHESGYQEVKNKNLLCSTGWAWDIPGNWPDCDASDCTSMTLTYSGVNPTLGGASCSATAGYVNMVEHSDSEEWIEFENDVAQDSALQVDFNGCQVTEVCASIHIYRNNALDDDRGPMCMGFDMGPPPGSSEGATCTKFTLGQPVIETKFVWIGDRWQAQNKVTLQVDSLTAGQGFAVRGIQKSQYDAYLAAGRPEGYSMPAQWLANVTTPGQYVANWTFNYSSFGASESSPPITADRDSKTVVALQVWSHAGWTATTAYQGNTEKTPLAGIIGVTDASQCLFYFGPQLLFRPGDDYDVPASDILDAPPVVGTPTEPEPTPQPPAQPAGCTFKISDPTTWLEGGMCALVGFMSDTWKWLMWGGLQAMLNAVAAYLVGTLLMPQIQSMLTSLFVPSDGYMDGRVGQLKTAWDGTSPALWLDGVEVLFDVPGVTGCTGIPVHYDMPGDAAPIDFTLGASCSGDAAQWASVTRLALSVVVLFAGAFACFRAILLGFFPHAGGWAGRVYD